ncbi:MAG: hypothetical protein VX026_14455, partial [Myxococcota bacterium]|nr:hypothetical protein [Myxococcota bacterium]
LTFRDPSLHICQLVLWMAESGDFDLGSCSQIWICSNTCFCGIFEKNGTGKGGHFQNLVFAGI